MNRPEQADVQSTFWDIVENNNFYEDILVPAIAAEDSFIQATLACADTFKLFRRNEEVVQEVYAGLEHHLSAQYDLPHHLSDRVFELCRKATNEKGKHDSQA